MSKNQPKKNQPQAGQWVPLSTGSLVCIQRATAHRNQPGQRGAAALSKQQPPV